MSTETPRLFQAAKMAIKAKWQGLSKHARIGICLVVVLFVLAIIANS